MSEPFNAAQTVKDSGLASGAYFKVKEGANKIRLMSPAVFHAGIFTDKNTGEKKPNNKFVAWVFDWSDMKVKLYFMPKKVMDQIAALQEMPDYKFETVPMPYDVTINVQDAGELTVVYSVVAARNNTEVPIDALNQMDGKEPIADVVEKLKENESKQAAPEIKLAADGLPATQAPF